MKNFNQADVAPGAAEEQLVNGKSVVDQHNNEEFSIFSSQIHSTMKENETINEATQVTDEAQTTHSMDDIIPQSITPTSLSDFKKKGKKVLFIKDFNREINKTNVRYLKKSVEQTKCFLRPAIVIPASMYLEVYEKGILYDPVDKSEYSNGNLGLDNCYVVLDGQHRLVAYQELQADDKCSLKPDLSVEIISLPDGVDAHSYIYALNTAVHSWTDKDRTQYIVASTKDKETGLSVAKKWQKTHGLGIRNAMAIIQFNDGYRAKMQKSFMSNHKLDPFLESTSENIKRGKELFSSFVIGFDKTPKLMKNMAPILAVIQIYTDTPDPKKTELVEKICKFFKTIEQKDVERIAALKAKEVMVSEFVQLWKVFEDNYTKRIAYRTDIDSQVKKLDEEYSSKLASDTKTKSK